jgi:predicted PurR-regulated permease PerM
MNTQKPKFSFLLILLAASFILAILILRPFIYSLILAVIFAVVFQPLYKRILKLLGGRSGLAALLTTVVIIVFILTPLVFIGIQIFKEAQQLYFSLTASGGRDFVSNIFNGLINRVQQLIPGMHNFSFNPSEYLKQGSNWLIKNLGAIFSNFAGMLVGFFIFLIAFYYLLKDGQNLKKVITDISPLPDFENEIILGKLGTAINSVIKGNLVIALIQGASTSVGLAIFGVPSAILWGVIAAITALIPGFGTSLVIIPAILYLFLTGHIVQAIGLVIWGALAVGLIDNFLGPKLVGRGMHLHPLLVILSVLGGAALFGPIGFLLGPLCLGLFLTLFDIYFYLSKKSGDI